MGLFMTDILYEQDYTKLPLFAKLDINEINELLQKFRAVIKHFSRSDYVYLAGDHVENLCVIISGTVQVLREDVWGEKSIIVNLEAGSVFGEKFLIENDTRSTVSYFVSNDSKILMLPSNRIFTEKIFSRTEKQLMFNILVALTNNNMLLAEKNEILCQKTLRGKILAYLEQEARHKGSVEFTVPFNRTDLANYLDADRSALTRELTRMKADSIIDFTKNTFILLNKNNL